MRKKIKLVHGVGVNDADYFVYEYENCKMVWICPYYRAWKNMLTRAYYYKCKNMQPTYDDVTVCEEWHSFMCFRSWMETQDWKGNHLDKDILVLGNKVYSPDTCVFVSRTINNFTTDRINHRGEWPLGVHLHKKTGKFRGKCSNPFTGELEHLGLFKSPDQAHQAWKKRKHELACQLADTQADERVAEALRIRYL